jgi:hypothetical protein
VRRAARAQTVKHRDATAAKDEALADFVEDTQPMHGFTTLLMTGSAAQYFGQSFVRGQRPLWAKRRSRSRSAPVPFCPRERTSPIVLVMSEKGQFQTRASSQFSVEANACPSRQCTVGWLLMGMGFPR